MIFLYLWLWEEIPQEVTVPHETLVRLQGGSIEPQIKYHNFRYKATSTTSPQREANRVRTSQPSCRDDKLNADAQRCKATSQDRNPRPAPPITPPCTAYPLQQAHLLELGAGVGQPLQAVGQVVVGGKVESVRLKHVVDHGQEGLVVLHLGQRNDMLFDVFFAFCWVSN